MSRLTRRIASGGRPKQRLTSWAAPEGAPILTCSGVVAGVGGCGATKQETAGCDCVDQIGLQWQRFAFEARQEQIRHQGRPDDAACAVTLSAPESGQTRQAGQAMFCTD